MTSFARVLPALLLLLHGGLLAWALVGLAEWFAPSVPWPAVSNALFPAWLLMLQWLAVLVASLLFIAGYALRWVRTPDVMVAAYALMAAVCAVETFGYLTHSLRFAAMALEYAAYVAILAALRVVPGFAARFAKPVPGTA